MCRIEPTVGIVNKKAAKLAKQLLGRDFEYLSVILFQRQSEEYRGKDAVFSIWREKQKSIMGAHGTVKEWPTSWIDLSEAHAFLWKVLRDGIWFLNQYYDLSSEENLLRNLPTSEKIGIGGGLERGEGVKQCLAHILLGDFDFVERYCSNEFKTVVPKNTPDLDKIMGALPELKKRYAETGKVV